MPSESLTHRLARAARLKKGDMVCIADPDAARLYDVRLGTNYKIRVLHYTEYEVDSKKVIADVRVVIRNDANKERELHYSMLEGFYEPNARDGDVKR